MRQNKTSLSIVGTVWTAEFSDGRLRASPYHRNNDRWLADKKETLPFPLPIKNRSVRQHCQVIHRLKSVSKICVGKNTRNCVQYFLTLVLFTFCTSCILGCLVCIVVSCLVCTVVVIMCVLLSFYVYLLYVFTLDAGLLARSQYSEGPATGHLDTGFSWFPCVYKQMLRWFPRFPVATTCFSCSPPNLNLLVTNLMFCIRVK
jgi:hypothetical protein